MKAIIVIDKMPKKCLDCELIWDEMNNGIVRCSNGRMLDEADIYKEKPSWCPLRPMPEKMTLNGAMNVGYGTDGFAYRNGWNACIDELLGETE